MTTNASPGSSWRFYGRFVVKLGGGFIVKLRDGQHLGKQIMDLDRQIAELTALRASVAGQYATVEAAEPRNCEAEHICNYI